MVVMKKKVQEAIDVFPYWEALLVSADTLEIPGAETCQILMQELAQLVDQPPYSRKVIIHPILSALGDRASPN